MKEFDIVYKQEEISDNFKTCNEAITLTITLAEYRYLVEENTRLNCENLRLIEETNRAIEEKETINRQRETQQKFWESELEKRSEPVPQQPLKHTLTSSIKKTGGEQV